MRYQTPRGTEDVLPADSYKWQRVESTFRELTRRYGYLELRTPTFEDTDVFLRTAGETSDIVTKEMYTFTDKGGRSITLKPEGTAPAMRSLLEHNLCPPGVVTRMCYIIPIFRYGRPQKGRLREAHQVGLELVGSPSPVADAEVIEITMRFYEALGITESVAMLNSIGRDECRRRFSEAILVHTAAFMADQPQEFQDRVHKNPLRLLDSKDPAAQEVIKTIPPITDYLEDESKVRFDRIQQLLTDAGVRYELAPEIVRGLDYYTETVFEVLSTKLGAQSSLCGGGRYDNLVRDLGGASTPSVGVAMGIERAIIVMDESGLWDGGTKPDVFVVQATESAFGACQKLVRQLRAEGLITLIDIDGKSMKSQLRQADKSGASLALILGDDEIAGNTVQLRKLGSSEQLEVPIECVVQRVMELK
jgi:histidyl-tRNA synthetase